MNKRFLLCTVSGVLFCSYSSWSYASPDIATSLSVVDSSSIQSTSDTAEIKPTLPEKILESSVSQREDSGSLKESVVRVGDVASTEVSQFTESSILESTTAVENSNSKRDSDFNSFLPAPTIQNSPPNPSESSQLASAQPAPNVLQTPLSPSSTEAAAALSMPTVPAVEKLSLGRPAPTQPVKPIRVSEERATIVSKEGSTLTQHDIKMHNKVAIASAENRNSVIKLIRGIASSDFIGLSVLDGGIVDATDVSVTAASGGLFVRSGTILMRDSTVIVTSDLAALGILFRNGYGTLVNQNVEGNGNHVSLKFDPSNVVLNNTKLLVEHGIGIDVHRTAINAKINLVDSEIRADVLLKNAKEEDTPANTLMLAADHSLLEGRVRTLEDNKTVFDLKSSTKWLLKANRSTENDDNIDSPVYEQFGVDRKSYSNLSRLKLEDSMIVFDKPMMGHYQTLFVGSDLQKERQDSDVSSVVYSAIGAAEIHLNSKWSSYSPVTEQKTDRLVIDGDVLGSTVVHINLLKKDKEITDSNSVWEEHMASFPLETHGISIIQVSGKANKNSFKLAENYTTMGGLPYKYVLTAYAPGTSHANQNLFGKNSRDFWDFRLQNAYIDKDRKIRALLPQVANYLIMPSSLFSAGFSDVSNQNVLLDNIQATMFGTENNKKKGVFLSSYGERVTLSSNRDPLAYGYGADVNYNALQIGVVLGALESKDINTHFGILGTYGKLAFTPKGMEDSEKTTFDKWSFTIYNGIQHSSGIYINTLLSYGTLKGDIATALVGNVAKLDGTGALSVSATVGKKLATATEGLTFEPQAQFVYQNLMFDVISDVNNLEVDMGNSRQWLIRMGGRLTQTLSGVEGGNALSFYGKLDVIKTFGDDGTIKIADTFYLDSTGASIEGSVGVNAYLSRNVVLHGDISYRQKLQKAGVSGISFSSGIRYHF